MKFDRNSIEKFFIIVTILNLILINIEFDKGGLNNNVNNNQHLVLFIRGKAISAIIIVILQLSDKLGRIEGFNNDPPREKGRR